MNFFFKKLRYWIIDYIQIQLFLSLISLVILSNWGLPYSLLSIIGNILFLPFLIFFLVNSIAIFFLQPIGISPLGPICVLEWVCRIWVICLNYGGHPRWLIGFRHYPAFFAIIITLSCILMRYGPIRQNAMRLFLMLFMIHVIFFSFEYLSRPHTIINTIFYDTKRHITLIYTNHKMILIDPGYLCNHASPTIVFYYKILPEIIKKTGCMKIDHFIILSSNLSNTALRSLIDRLRCYTPISTTYICHDQSPEEISSNNRSIVYTHSNPVTIFLAKHDYLTICPIRTYISYRRTLYPPIKVTGHIDKNPVSFYSAKYRVNRTRKENYDR